MSITLKSIAEKTGFGYGTVARALSAHPTLVKEETRKKILEVAEKYGYIKNVSAQTLVTGKTKDLGLVIPAIFGSPYYNDFYIKVISGIMNALTSHEYNLRILFLRDKTEIKTVQQEIKALNLRGLILSPYCQDFFIKKEDIKKLKIPVVVLGKHIKGNNITSIVLDDLKGGYEGTKYLIESGHRRIAVIRGFRQDIERRYAGYIKALEESGIKTSKKLILKGDGMAETGYSETISLIESKTKVTAIFCLDDEMAYGAIQAIKDSGLKCPEDISVLGFDGINTSAFTEPKLTTMERPVSLMGERAINILLGREKNKDLKVKAELIERESCKRMN